MAPQNKGKSSLDQIKAFNMAVGQLRLSSGSAKAAASQEKALAEIEQIVSILLKISDMQLFSPSSRDGSVLLLNTAYLLDTLDYKSNLLWNLVNLLSVISSSHNPTKIQRTYSFLPTLTRILHTIPSTTRTRTVKLLQLMFALVQDISIVREEAYLLVLLEDLLQFAQAKEQDLKHMAIFILATLCRGNRLASKMVFNMSTMTLEKLLQPEEGQERNGLAIEALTFHIQTQVPLNIEQPPVATVREILINSGAALLTAYKENNHLEIKFIRDFIKDMRETSAWLEVLRGVDYVPILKDILSIPAFNDGLNAVTNELYFSVLDQISQIYASDDLILFNLVFKVVLARLDVKPYNDVANTLDLVNNTLKLIDLGNITDADCRNLKFQVDQILPSLLAIFLDGDASARNRKQKNEEIKFTPSQIDCYVSCVRLLTAVACNPTWTNQLLDILKADKMVSAFHFYRSQCKEKFPRLMLTVEFLNLARLLAETDSTWKSSYDLLQDDTAVMHSVVEVMREESVLPDIYAKAVKILSTSQEPPTSLLPVDDLVTVSNLVNEPHSTGGFEQPERLDSLMESITESLGQLDTTDPEADVGASLLGHVVSLHSYGTDRYRDQIDLLRNALDAADKRVVLQNHALENKECQLRETQQVMNLIASKYAALRTEIKDLRNQQQMESAKSETILGDLKSQLSEVRKERDRLTEDHALLTEKHAKFKAKADQVTEQLRRDLEQYMVNEEQLQERLKAEQKAREEVTAQVNKRDDKLKKASKQLEEEISKRERMEKKVEDMNKQNASLEALSKGQEQALNKKEKQLQDVTNELAELKRVQEAIFNLSKSRAAAGSC